MAGLVSVVLACLGAGAELAQQQGNAAEVNPLGMYISHAVPGTYVPGQPVEVMVSLNFASVGSITALGLTEILPPGWTFQSMGNLVAGLLPTVTPQPGAQDEIGFAWITIPPEFPFQFSYYLLPPEDSAGSQSLSGQGEYRLTGGGLLSDIDTVLLNGKDTSPPRITLLGANPVTLEQGEPFVEPGYKATDNVDGDITGKVQVSGNVNAEVVGTYTLTYTVSDKAGNAATPVTRSVIVVEPQDEGNSGGGSSGGGSGGGSRPRPNRGNYGGYGYYPGQDYYDNPASQQNNGQPNPQDPQAAQAAQAAQKNNPLATAAQAMQARNAAAAAANSAGLSPGSIRAVWPMQDAGQADDPDAKEVVPPSENGVKDKKKESAATPADAATAAAAPPETGLPDVPATATSLAATSAATVTAGNTNVVAASAVPTPEANTAVAAAAPSEPAKPGFFEGMSLALSKMQTADWLRLMVVVAVLAVIAVLAGLAWRVAYSPPPQRKTGNGVRN